MEVFKVLVGSAENNGIECELWNNDGVYTLIKPIKCKNGKESFIEEPIDKISWAKQLYKGFKIGRYVASWFDDSGDIITAHRIITVLEEIEFE